MGSIKIQAQMLLTVSETTRKSGGEIVTANCDKKHIKKLVTQNASIIETF
jgi:hypothetical protein